MFISYAHDDDAHTLLVRELWSFLRSCGIDAQLDLPAADRRQDWPLWMADQLRTADHVLVVASRAYRERAEGRSGQDLGRGVRWEARLIRDAFYRDARALDRFVPVVLPGQTTEGVPDFLAPNSCTVYHVREFTVGGATPLLRLLTNQPAYVEPPLGVVPLLGPSHPRQITDDPVDAQPGHHDETIVLRPDELDAVIAALSPDADGATVGITTGVHGAGGFGKTTLAAMVRDDPRIRRRFGDRVVWTTLGRDRVSRESITQKLHEVIRQVAPTEPVRNEALARAVDVEAAGTQLGRLLQNAPPWLLIVDDVWTDNQLIPFIRGGRAARLVTTRNRDLLVGRGTLVKVDRMTTSQAKQLLLRDVPAMAPSAVAALLAVTGGWALLLRLVNAILVRGARAGHPDLSQYGRQLAHRLETSGPGAVDELGPADHKGLDLSDPPQRAKAIRATMRASTELLDAADTRRLTELAIFAEDENVPVVLVDQLWARTGPTDPLRAPLLRYQLAELALITTDPTSASISMHDVVRDYLQDLLERERGEQEIMRLHRIVIDQAAAALPGGAWWELPADSRYLWDHLITHLLAAGQPEQAESTATNLHWVAAKLLRFGPPAVIADLARLTSPRTARMLRSLSRTAHLLAPTEPPHSVVDILCSRLADDPDWEPQILGTFSFGDGQPRLMNLWPLPDVPEPGLYRAIAGHDEPVSAIRFSPDGTWLASAGEDGTVRLWDPVTGRRRAEFDGHGGRHVNAIAISPDGTWLASGGGDGRVGIWDPATGRQLAVLGEHGDQVISTTVSPDGRWLVTRDFAKRVNVWNTTTWSLHAHHLCRQASGTVAFDPGGTLLAVSDVRDGVNVVDIREWASWQLVASLPGQDGHIAVAFGPDGDWLATACPESSLRIWDTSTWQQLEELRVGEGVSAIAVSPDGAWLACGRQRAVDIWDTTTWQKTGTLGVHGEVTIIAISPDGRLLADNDDTTIRIWDTTAKDEPAPEYSREPVQALAVNGDGSWAAVGGETVKVWETGTGRELVELLHDDVRAAAVSADDSWLVIGTADGSVTVWDTVTWEPVHTMAQRFRRLAAVAVSPDREWLAVLDAFSKVVTIWANRTWQQLCELRGAESDEWFTTAVVSPDGGWLAVGSFNGILRMWDTATWDLVTEAKIDDSEICALAAAPDGKWLAIGSRDETTTVWDTVARRQLTELHGHHGAVRAVDFSPDGRWLLTACSQREIRIWDTRSWRQAGMMRTDAEITACTWPARSDKVIVGGDQGLYIFGFLSTG